MRMRSVMLALTLAMMPVNAASASQWTVLNSVVAFDGSAVLNCGTTSLCAGDAALDVQFVSVQFGAYDGPATGKLIIFPPEIPTRFYGSIKFTINTDINSAVALDFSFALVLCSARGPNFSEGGGVASMERIRSGGTVTVTFNCDAVLIER